MIGALATHHRGAPSQASAAGFNTLIFSDDFNVAGTVAPDGTAASGFKWYPYISGGPITTADWSVNTSQTAATNNGGNGGANASANGGILSIHETITNSNEVCLITMSNSTLSAGASGNAASYGGLGNGFWKHFYIEAYIRFAASNGPSGSLWPAFWGAGVDWWHNSNHTEMDYMENLHPNNYSTTIHQWIGYVDTPSGGVIMVNQKTVDANWHTYGLLWTSTGAGTGKIQSYFDNVLQSTSLTGTGQTISQLEANIGQEIQLGAGNASPMYLDWVRVWQ